MKSQTASSLIFAVFVLVAILAGFWQSSAQHDYQVKMMRNLLAQIRQNASPATFYERKCRQLLEKIVGKPFDGQTLSILKAWKNNVPGVKVYAMLFDSDCNPISSMTYGFPEEAQVTIVESSGTFRFPYNSYHKSWFSKLRLPYSLASKMGVGSINNILKALRKSSQGRPGRFYFWNRSREERGMGIWNFKKQNGNNQVAGVLLAFEPELDMERLVFTTYVEKMVKKGFAVGYFDQISPDSMLTIPGLPESKCFQIQEEYVSSGLDTLEVGQDTVVFSTVSASGVLVGRIHAVNPKIQAHLLFCAFLSLPIFWWLGIGREFNRPPLIVFLIVLVVFSGVIPLVISVFFWQNLEKNRFQAVLNREEERLLELLTSLDQRFFTTLQLHDRKYRDWTKQFQSEYNRNPEQYSRRGLKGIERFLGDFPKNSTFSKLIERTKHWDREGSIDSFTLVSSSGVFLRENSVGKNGARKIAGFPIKERILLIDCAAERGNSFMQEIIPDLLGKGPNDLTWKDWVNLGSGVSERSFKLGSQIFQESFRRMNAKFHSGKDGKTQEFSAISLVMDTIQGLEGLDFGKWMDSADGEMKAIQKNDRRQTGWIGNIKASSGENIYGIIVVHIPMTLEQTFLKEVFAAKKKWPNDVKFFAVALNPEGMHFPRPFLHRFFSPLIRSIEPPGVSQVRTIETNQGEKRLLAILKCPKTLGYALAATAPLDSLWKEMAVIHEKLVSLGILMGIIIFTLGVRLKMIVVNPVHSLTAGIDAMEKNSHDFRVEAQTGDEWQEIAEIFNQSLQGMAELEAAKIVQQKLFPRGVVENGSYSFVGENIMLSMIGGDYFDCEVTDDNRLMFIFGDVSGHGVSAALVMAIAKSGFSSFIHFGERSPGQLLKKLNDLIIRVMKRRRMMTCTLGIANPDGTVILANAGQFPPFIDPDVPGFPDFKAFGSVPIGATAKFNPPEVIVKMAPGSSLVFYSDGIIEARNQNGEQFDMGNLQEALAASTGASPKGLISAVHKRLRAFTKGVPWEDDVSVAVLTRKD